MLAKIIQLYVDKYFSACMFTVFSFFCLPDFSTLPWKTYSTSSLKCTGTPQSKKDQETLVVSPGSHTPLFFRAREFGKDIWTKCIKQPWDVVFFTPAILNTLQIKGVKPKCRHCTARLKYCWMITWKVALIRFCPQSWKLFLFSIYLYWF